MTKTADDLREEAKKKVDAQAKKTAFINKLTSNTKTILLILSIGAILVWVIARYFFSSDKRARKLLDIIHDESNKKIAEKEEVAKNYDKKIKEIEKIREKTMKEIDNAGMEELKEIIRRRGL